MMQIPGLDPYKYGKQVVKQVFQKLDADLTQSYPSITYKKALYDSKKGLIELVKENPKDFYTQVGQFQLRSINQHKAEYEYPLDKYRLKTILYLAAMNKGISKDINPFKTQVINDMKLNDLKL